MDKETQDQSRLLESPHAMSVEEVMKACDTSEQGLNAEAVARQYTNYGANELPVVARESSWKRFFNQFRNVLIYVLIVSAIISLLLEHLVDSGVILLVIVVNAIVGYIQEGKAERALQAIMVMTRTQCTVVRDDTKISIDSSELVPGDIVLLQAGDRVPADIRLYFCKNLRCDESALTGESQPVDKQTQEVPGQMPLAERGNMVYMGTMVTFGVARGIVCKTGIRTEIGTISEMVQQTVNPKTPLQMQLANFARQLSLVIIVVSLLLMLFGMVVRDYAFSDMFQAAISIAVATIPEGLPAIVTIALAIGVQRMSQNRALVRRLPSVEVLGSVDVICTDKTGTLTTNEMTVRELVTSNGHYTISGEGYLPEGAIADKTSGEKILFGHDELVLRTTLLAMLCNDSSITEEKQQWKIAGDPTEGALLVLALKAGLVNSDVTRDWPRSDELPFESERRYMATLHENHENRGENNLAAVKGSPDVLLDFCTRQLTTGGTEPLDRQYWHDKADALAASGMRVIALVQKSPVTGLSHEAVNEEMTMVALTGINDPPRPEAMDSIRACRQAGITVKMITGDNPLTAQAIGRELGLSHLQVVTGQELDAMDEAGLDKVSEKVDLYARTSPANKLALVNSLRRSGHVVAMTGDGVNDAPALRQADIGVAMGHKGTDAAREAADIVLVDDRFSTIALAVKEGRTVYDNIVKSILFILPTSLAEAVVIITAIFMGTVLPITPAQILWINMVTTVTLALALAFEPPEPGIMDRPPRPPGQELISGRLLLRICLVVAVSASIIFLLFTHYLAQGESLELSRTIAINTLVLIEAIYLINCRYLSQGIFTWRILTGALPSILAIIGVLILQILFTYLPLSQRLFGLESMTLHTWFICLGAALPILFVVEIEKIFLQKIFARKISEPDAPA